VLNIKGRVLPATLESVRLRATLKDGSAVLGETSISRSHAPIERLSLEPSEAEPLTEVLDAIAQADAIVLGPGSLFTSILPNLLVRRVATAIAAANCPKIYICNVMTQPGETDGYSASDHVAGLLEQAGARVCDYAIVNLEPPSRLLETYAEGGQEPVQPDPDKIDALGVRVVEARVISETETVRHDPQKLAEVVLKLIDDTIAERASFVRLATQLPVKESPPVAT